MKQKNIIESKNILNRNYLGEPSRLTNKKRLNESFKKTTEQMQKDLGSPSLIFSKIIHNKIIEKLSEVIGHTLARPNAILFGSFFAFISTLSIYLVARYIGYQLSGSECMISFIIGWIFGILFDYFKIIITGKK